MGLLESTLVTSSFFNLSPEMRCRPGITAVGRGEGYAGHSSATVTTVGVAALSCLLAWSTVEQFQLELCRPQCAAALDIAAMSDFIL